MTLPTFAIRDILSSSPSLSSLIVRSEDEVVFEDDSFDPNISNLDYLSLTVCRLLNTIVLVSSLVHLELDFIHDSDNQIFAHSTSITLPRLVALKAAGPKGVRAVSFLKCPNLQELYLSKCCKVDKANEALQYLCDRLATAQLNPTTLKIRKIQCKENWLLTLLSHMASITKLDMFPPILPESFWRSFYEQREGFTSLILPSLERLIVRGDLTESATPNIGPTLPMLKRLKRERHQLNMPVEINNQPSLARSYHVPYNFLVINNGEPVHGRVRMFNETRDGTKTYQSESSQSEDEMEDPDEMDSSNF